MVYVKDMEVQTGEEAVDNNNKAFRELSHSDTDICILVLPSPASVSMNAPVYNTSQNTRRFVHLPSSKAAMKLQKYIESVNGYVYL